jgi:hypothetical protein
MGMNAKMMEVLGKTAYNKHVGLNIGKNDGYFKIDVTTWEELPTSSRHHWINIAHAVVSKANVLDCGDLD